jgi:hypothetical protein
MEKKDVIGEDTLQKIEVAMAKGRHWAAYNSRAVFFSPDTIELFRTKGEAIGFAAVRKEAGDDYHIFHALTPADLYRRLDQGEGKHPEAEDPGLAETKVISEVRRPKKVTLSMSREDYDRICNLCAASACRTMSEYARKVLLQKPVIVIHRNQAAEDFLAAAIEIKNELQAAVSYFDKQSHQTDGLDSGTEKQLLMEKAEEIRRLLTQIYEQCLHT